MNIVNLLENSIDKSNVEKLTKENEAYTRRYNYAKNKLNEIDKMRDTEMAGNIILSGLQKEIDKSQKRINLMKSKIEKIEGSKEKEQKESGKIVSYYKEKVIKFILID